MQPKKTSGDDVEVKPRSWVVRSILSTILVLILALVAIFVYAFVDIMTDAHAGSGSEINDRFDVLPGQLSNQTEKSVDLRPNIPVNLSIGIHNR